MTRCSLSSSYIKVIFGTGLWKTGLPQYSTTSEFGPLPLGEETYIQSEKEIQQSLLLTRVLLAHGMKREYTAGQLRSVAGGPAHCQSTTTRTLR